MQPPAFPSMPVASPDWGDPGLILQAIAPLLEDGGPAAAPLLTAPDGLPRPDAAPSSAALPLHALHLPQQAAPMAPTVLQPAPTDCLLPMDDPALQRALTQCLTPAGTAAAEATAPSLLPLAPKQPQPHAMPPSPTGALTSLEVDAIRREFPILQQQVNGHPLAWLDNAATTQKPLAVMQALERFYARDNSNIHRAAHTLAARATDAYEAARATVQRFLGAADAREIVFVRGTTEAINLVAQSWGRSTLRPGDEVVVTTLEHHANIVPWQMACQATGATLRAVPITDAGEVDMAAYMRMLSPRVKMVALAHVSNVLGTVLPVREMTAMARAVGARVLVDGAQSVAHEPVNVQALGCDFYVFSGHKIFGPTGVGALYGRHDLLEAMPPWQGGGNMIRDVSFEQTTYADVPAKFEAGTATLGDAVGLGAALDWLQAIGLPRAAAWEQGLLHAATAELSRVPGLRIFGQAPHKAAVVSFLIDGIDATQVGRALDQVGIAVRTGHHCAQPTMQRYGVKGMVRPSFALYNTFEEVERLVRAVWQIRRTGQART